ncbi:MAG: hypothetical protein R3C10_11370 [Pirellulales bacterium]|nr:hypothetical protein [Planctomycetales bacterium]
MRRKNRWTLASVLAIAGAVSMTGCQTQCGPQLGLLAYPIPVSPYFQDKHEDDYWVHERYERAPILGPIVDGAPPIAMDPPSDDEVMRQLEETHPVEGGIPLFYTVQRNNVSMTKELIADYIDPPRIYPLIGPAQLHHAHYKCTVYFTEVTRRGWPLPYTTVDEDAREVIYIDHDHLHMVGNVNEGLMTDVMAHAH